MATADRAVEASYRDRELSQSIISDEFNTESLNESQCCRMNLCAGSRGALARLFVLQGLLALATYVIIINVTTYGAFLDIGWSGELSLVFQSVLFLPGPFFGWLGDRKISKHSIILAGFIGIFIGSIPVTITGWMPMIDEKNLSQGNGTEVAMGFKVAYISGVAIVSLSGAAIYTVLFPYMLEHVDDDKRKHKVLASFCTWAYIAYNLGATIACLLGGVLQTLGILNDGDGKHKHSAVGKCRVPYSGFGLAYLLCPLASLIAVVLLVAWRKQYLYKSPAKRPEYRLSFSTIAKAAFKKHPKAYYQGVYDRTPLMAVHLSAPKGHKRKMTEELQKRLAVIVLPMMAMIVYGCVNQLMYVTNIKQGERLNISFHRYNRSGQCPQTNVMDFSPPSLLASFNCMTVLLALPVIYYFTEKVYPLSHLIRIRWGLILAAWSCASSLIVEWQRMKTITYYGINTAYVSVGNIHFVSVYTNLSFLYQIPQYMLMGLSQGLALVASAEFVLSRAPPGYKAITFGFLNLFIGVGVLLGVIILSIMKRANFAYQSIPIFHNSTQVKSYTSNEISSKAYVFHLFFIYLMILNVIFYVWVEYRHKDVRRPIPSTSPKENRPRY